VAEPQPNAAGVVAFSDLSAPREYFVIEAVVFDLGNTVLTSTSTGFRDDRWERVLGLDPGVFGRKVWGSPMEQAALVGSVSFSTFWAWVGETLDLDDRQLDALDAGMWEGIVLLPEVAGLFSRLQGRYRLAALSNAWSDARGHIECRFRIDELVEFIAYSCEIGFAKPDRRAFLAVTDRLGVLPEHTLFIDDSLANITAAAELGMQTVQCRNPHQMVRDVNAVLVGPGC
jgi:FMN phosphatase YigB (HAD superfamily)